jgi:hypothetical protein
MTVTLADMKGRIKQMLQGYTRNQEQITWLTSNMAAGDTSFNVDPGTASLVTRGLVEIDNELLLVNTFNSTTGLVQVAANTNGRGVENTVAASHLTNAIVRMDPDYPLQRITEAINDTIQSTYPDLYVMSNFEFTKVAARYEYDMPAEAEDVLKVIFDTIGPSRVWPPSQSWRFNPQASLIPEDGSATGKSIQVMDQIIPGRDIRVTYTKKPGVFTSDSQDYETTVGYPERTIDMIQFGAVARLLSGVEAARLQQKSIESTERAPLVPTGAASNASQYYWNMYQKRLNEEVDRIHQLFPSYQTFLS